MHNIKPVYLYCSAAARGRVEPEPTGGGALVVLLAGSTTAEDVKPNVSRQSLSSCRVLVLPYFLQWSPLSSRER